MRFLQVFRSSLRAFAVERFIRVLRTAAIALPRLTVGAFLCVHAFGQEDGSRQWAVTVTNSGGISFSAPVVSPDGSSVYVGVINGSGGRLISVSREGAVKWTFDRERRGAFIDSSPAVAPDGTVYIGCGDGRMYALTPADRSVALKWELNVNAFITSSPAIAADGTVYFGAADAQLHAVTPAGNERWAFPTGDVVDSSPAIGADGTIYFGSYDGNVYAVTPGGTEKWRFRTGGRIFASPAIGADGTIYVGSGDQRLYAIAPDGTRRWDYFTNGDIQSSPVLAADGTVYFAADVSFYALRPGLADERLRWKVSLNASSASTAAVRADGMIIVGADDGIIRGLAPEDGSTRWSYDTKTGVGNYIESSPIIAPDGSIYIGSFDGHLYKLNGNGSPLSSYSSWPAFRRDIRHTGRAVASNQGGHLANLATRAQAGGNNNLVAGFVVQGATERTYLMRAVGPGLAKVGFSGFLADPRLALYSGDQPLQTNDNWRERDEVSGFSVPDTAAGVGAFPLDPGSSDAAIVRPLPPGAFTALVSSADGSPGVALVEVYDARAGDQTGRLLNLSTRGQVGTGQNVLIAGLVVGGTGSIRLLLRGIGPSLAQFRVPGVLAQPRMEVFRGQVSLGSNTGWTSNGAKGDLAGAAATVSAFRLADPSADCAMLLDAAPGEYTIQISGVGGTTGEAMVEVYVLP